MQTVQLSEDLGMYVDKLRAEFASIQEIWLVGARANGSAEPSDEWELLTFADRGTLGRLRGSPDWHRPDVNLLVVVDGDRYEPAWGETPGGRLRDIGWSLEDPQTATYAPTGEDASGQRLDAVRVR